MCLGVPGQIESIIDADNALAWVNLSGVRREVNIACVVDDRGIAALVGNWIIVHAGFALETLDADEARHTLSLLHEIEASQSMKNEWQS